MITKNNVCLTKAAERKFNARKPKNMFSISAEEFCEDMDFYIGCHAKAGTEFNRSNQFVVYNENMIVTMHAVGFIWVITDITICDTTGASGPLFFWRIIVRGAKYIPTMFRIFKRSIRNAIGRGMGSPASLQTNNI